MVETYVSLEDLKPANTMPRPASPPSPPPPPSQPSGPSPAASPNDGDSERLRTLVEAVTDYAIFTLDAEGHVTSWNTGAQRIKGYARDEIIGQHFSRFYTDEARARNWPGMELETAARIGRFEDEGWRVRKDGTRFWANVVITALRDPEGHLLGFGKVTRDIDRAARSPPRPCARARKPSGMLVESVKDYAIFMLDPHGRVMSWNAGASYQGLPPRRDRRQALLGLLSRRGPGGGQARPRAAPSPAPRAAWRTKAGACARMARCSGPT